MRHLTCLIVDFAEFTDFPREFTASSMRSVVFPGWIFDSRKPYSRVGESENSMDRPGDESLIKPSNALLVPSLEWGLGRENVDDSANGSVVGITSRGSSSASLCTISGDVSAPALMSKLVPD